MRAGQLLHLRQERVRRVIQADGVADVLDARLAHEVADGLLVALGAGLGDTEVLAICNRGALSSRSTAMTSRQNSSENAYHRRHEWICDSRIDHPRAGTEGLPQHITASPDKIGDITRAALVLTHFEHGYIT